MCWHLTLCTEWSVGTENGANAYFKTLLPFCPRRIIENIQILFTNMQLYKILIIWITCGLLWFVFICCLDSHSDGTHSLQRIYWCASDAMQNLFKSVPVGKKTTFWMGWGWAHVHQILVELFLQTKITKTSKKKSLMCAEESFTIKPGMVNLDFMLTWTCGALSYKNPAKRSRLHLHCVFGLQPSNLFRVPVHSLPPDWLHFQPVPDLGHATCLSSSNPDHSNYSLQPAWYPTMQWLLPHSPCNHECTT